MSGHTPGPWATDGDQIYTEDIPHRMRSYVASVKLHNAERKANARLLAAAPEMLRALKKAVGELETHCGCKEIAARGLPAMECALCIFVTEPARKALAKATGEEAERDR